MDTNTLAYLAGIIDGEGCIAIYGYHGRWRNSRGKKQRGFRLDVKVGMAEPQAVKLFKDTFGGSIQIRTNMPGATKPAYNWCVSGKLAIACLKLLTPFLLVKKGQAEIALDFHQTRIKMGHKYGYNPYTEEEFMQLVGFAERIKAIKKEVVPLN